MKAADTKPEGAFFSSEVQRALHSWLAQPREASLELLGGHLVRKAMATGEHGAAQGGVFGQLLRLQGPIGAGTRWWLTQEVDLYLGGEGMRPDVAGWRIDRHPEPPPRVSVGDHLGVIVEPPDWVCEVLSTSTVTRDRGLKWKAYQRAGVEWYWLVDVWHRSVTAYRRTERSYEVAEVAYAGETARLPPFEEVELVVDLLFVYRSREPAGG